MLFIGNDGEQCKQFKSNKVSCYENTFGWRGGGGLYSYFSIDLYGIAEPKQYLPWKWFRLKKHLSSWKLRSLVALCTHLCVCVYIQIGIPFNSRGTLITFLLFFLYWIIVIIEQKGNSWHIYGGENYCHPFYWK